MAMRGARYIHILVPCPLGWGAASHDTVRLARLAHESGLFPVFEAVYGEISEVTKIRRRVPVEEYLRPQRRFAHLFSPARDEVALARLQSIADRNIRRHGLLDDAPQAAPAKRVGNSEPAAAPALAGVSGKPS
jgi:pyruvate ferredoxin oxidoreductase beta subunit